MAGTIIIGGGAIGLSVAYHLGQHGVEDVVLVERNALTSGTSWHAAGIVGPLRASLNMTRLAMYAGELFPRLERETGMQTGYRQTGGYWIARREERMDELQRIAAIGRYVGLTPEIIGAEQLGEEVPGLNPKGIAGALKVAEDASVNPVDLCMAYARAAKVSGVSIREGAQVSAIVAEKDRVVGVRLATGEEIDADRVALCAGAWSKLLADDLGITLPLQPVEHMYVVSEPIADLPSPFPVLRDLERGIYVKGDTGKLVLGGFEPDAKCWDPAGPEGDRAFLELAEDWDQFTPFMEAGLGLLPVLETAGIQHFMNGPESFTFDSKPLVGQCPELANLFVAAGMNSVGVMSSAGIGRALAAWMVGGGAPGDLWEIDVARCDPRAASAQHLQARMTEAVADNFAMHWPYKQPGSGRDLRVSVLHRRWADAGAVFGLTAGWERGLYYAETDEERSLAYSVSDQPWWSIAEREAQWMNTGTVMIDLSPFSKFDVSGSSALEALQRMCTANVDVDPGVAVYTPMLNRDGGIEADLTVTRMDEARFRITSGAATRWKDMAWLKRHGRGGDVEIVDRTEDEAVIGVMGAGARALLASLSADDWQGFAFSTARAVTVAGVGVTATRLSFVGEMGWELSIPVAQAERVFDAVHGAGARPMGHYAIDGCRIEKGFKHWGLDLGPEVTPLEVGLGFAVDWSKDGVIGREALLEQKGPWRDAAAGVVRGIGRAAAVA